jgi:hypothetical protein
MYNRIGLTFALAFVLNQGGSWAGPPQPNIAPSSPTAIIETSNTAIGQGALANNTTGNYNTASGLNTLYKNLGGWENTASGSQAMQENTDGSYNTATGQAALFENTLGNYNTGTGLNALFCNTTGSLNTAMGANALICNTTGIGQSAFGANTLRQAGMTNYNTAFGSSALAVLGTGNSNVGVGSSAFATMTTGQQNTSLGNVTFQFMTAGDRNIGLGYGAGKLLTSGSDNIYVGTQGGAPTESKTLRLGSVQTRAFLAGVSGVPVVGNTVLINSQGQLGVLVSSARYKQDVVSLQDQSGKIQRLRPVSFHYKQLPQESVQYGLIAEEVAKVYPELVTRNAQGKIEGVRYDELTPLLLVALQQQHRELTAMQTRIEELSYAINHAPAYEASLTPIAGACGK